MVLVLLLVAVVVEAVAVVVAVVKLQCMDIFQNTICLLAYEDLLSVYSFRCIR